MISVLLPTIRPDHWRPAVESLPAAADGVLYEVVIVADFAGPDDPGLRWIVRPRRGVIDAINVAYAEARGDTVFLMNDESWLEAGALRRLHEACVATPGQIVSPVHVPAFPFTYYGVPFVPFPFATRALLDSLGGLMDPVYRGFYADPDLSLRAHAAGVPIRIVPDARLHHAQNLFAAGHQESLAAYLDADRATFRQRWDHLGAFCDP